MALANCSIPAITRSTLAAGSMLYFNSTSAGWNRLLIGANQTIMTSNGTSPGWSTLATILAYLGTTNGSVPMCQAGTWSAFAPGASGKLLKGAGVSSVPTWGDITSAMLDTTLGSTNGSVAVRTAGTWGQRVQRRVQSAGGTVSSAATNNFGPVAWDFTPTTIICLAWGNSRFSVGVASTATGSLVQSHGHFGSSTSLDGSKLWGDGTTEWACPSMSTSMTFTQSGGTGANTWNVYLIAIE